MFKNKLGNFEMNNEKIQIFINMIKVFCNLFSLFNQKYMKAVYFLKNDYF